MKTKVSIIIPAFNIRDYIEKCLQSVLDQEYEKESLEIIVVDDGSTDGTSEILDEYASKNNIIKVIHKPNEGVSAARNDGIKASTGEYIFFFDGDDFQERYTCSELVDIIKQQSADAVIYGDYRYEDGKSYETSLPRF